MVERERERDKQCGRLMIITSHHMV